MEEVFEKFIPETFLRKNMNYYVLIWLLVVPLILLVGWRDNRWITMFRLGVSVLIGWILINKAVILHWDSNLLEAVTDAQIKAVTENDGGQKAFAFVFGWIPAGCYSALCIGIHTLIKKTEKFWRP